MAAEGDDRGWDGWLAPPTQWTWVWASSGRWWRTGMPGIHGVAKSQTWLSDWTTTTKMTYYPQGWSIQKDNLLIVLLSAWKLILSWEHKWKRAMLKYGKGNTGWKSRNWGFPTPLYSDNKGRCKFFGSYFFSETSESDLDSVPSPVPVSWMILY